MIRSAHSIAGAIAIGVGATLLMDVWNLFLKRAFGIPSLNYCMLGRWVRHMERGTFRHASIAAAAPRPFECTVGWIAHYGIGIGLAVVFVVLVARDWLAEPTLLPAVLYGVVTVVSPFFIMQPSLGLGVAASKAPSPFRARLKSLATHTVFGIGLYVSAVGVSYVMRSSPAGTAMNDEQLKDFATRYTAAWCSQTPSRVAAFFSERGSLTINNGAPAVGRPAITAAAQAFMTGYPDMIVAMDSVKRVGDRVQYHWTFTGRNTGPGGTGRAVRQSGYEDWSIGADGLVAESLGHYDAAAWQRQVDGK